MQITLVQSEIEQALTNHINGLINIKEGMEVKIDLSAGRGADGFKATIDIVPLVEVVQPAVVVKATKSETKPAAEEKQTKSDPKADKPASKQAVVKAEQTQISTGVGAEAGSANLAGDDNAADNGEQTGEVEVEEEQQQEEKPVRKSLFGALSKPVNE